jgi:hypothetical protein
MRQQRAAQQASAKGQGVHGWPALISAIPGRLGDATLVRLKVRINSGVEVPVGQSTGCP